MPNEKSAVQQFLEGTENEQANPFNLTPEQNDPFAQQEVVEQTEVIEKEEKEKPIPFNKDPKVLKFIEKEISKRLESLKPESPEEKADPEVTDVLTRLIGNDTPEKLSMVKEFQKILERGTQRAKEEAVAELQSYQQQEILAEQQDTEQLENAFDSIEESYKVDITSNNPIAKKTRQEFVSFIEKIAPKDADGDIVEYPDMQSAWETFSEMKKYSSTPSRAKELASRSMSRSSEAVTAKPKIGSWDSVLEDAGLI